MAQGSLYPSFLFHFTNKDALYSILSSTFNISYAREKIKGRNKVKEFAVPMVSFSDLRLSELKVLTQGYGTDPYGKFGIALSKDWAYKNGLNPVLYLSEKNNFTDEFLKSIENLHGYVDSGTTSLTRTYHELLNILRYAKSYQGELRRFNRSPIADYIYANEREWRYVPPLKKDIGNDHFLSISRIDTKAKKAAENQKIIIEKLGFGPHDIQYLIVEHDKDILPLIRHLEIVKPYPEDVLKKLYTKILTIEQIENDI